MGRYIAFLSCLCYNEHMDHEHPRVERNSATQEIIDPRNLPEAAFQSYEKLKNDATAQRMTFMTGEFRNPELHYPALEDTSDVTDGINRLHETIAQVREIETDEQKADIIATTLEFRAAEMEYVELLSKLNHAVESDYSADTVRTLAGKARTAGEHLYGAPDKMIANAAHTELWTRLDAKTYSPTAQKLYDELRDGFEWQGERIAPLARPESHETLPEFEHPSLGWAGEIILEEYADMESFFGKWWRDKQALHGEDYVASPADIADAYELAFQLIDPDDESGVQVVLDSDAAALSWDSSLMAIKVGGKRAAIETPGELFRKFLHEGVGHGGRAINGLKTGLPVLGTGLYTDTERPDYLTFEEGFCTTVEEAVSDVHPNWNGVKLGHYLNIARVAQGEDFRSVYETAWRYRLLADLPDGQVVTDDMIKKAQRGAYTAAVRIFRGTPTRLTEKYPDIKPLTYNKDLAYLNGRVLAMNHVRELQEHNDKDGLLALFDAKYDPTVPEQAEIVATYQTSED